VSAPAFLSPPVEHAAPGVAELRGTVDGFPAAPGERVVRLTGRRAVVLVEGPALPVVERARAAGLRAYDVTAAHAALTVENETLLRRVTELDPGTLPAAGPVARGVPAVVLPEGDGFRVLVPRELAEYVAGVLDDLRAGLP
jgi:hypothetical protein